jgi:hypothetical protein
MGADGGLNWMPIKKVDKFNHAIKLIAPLGILDYRLRQEDYEWLELNEKLIPACCILSKYGTDMNHQGLDDLYEILEYDDDTYDDWTFLEVLEDIYSCPESQSWQEYQNQSSLRDKLKLEGYFYTDSPFEDKKEKFKYFINMKIGDWKRELKDIIDYRKIGSVETWT